MTSSQIFSVNSPKVIFEEIQGELVIINLDSGHYYSVIGSGPEIWTLLLDGGSLSQIIKQLENSYPSKIDEITKSVTDFVDQLIAEALIVPANSGSASQDNVDSLPQKTDNNQSDNATSTDFQSPVIEKFTDMEEMLLLDPIHEVDEAGWPNLPQK